jgi:hypothetical protein
MPRARKRPKKRRTRTRRARATAAPRPMPAETRLLALARDIARLPLPAAVEKLAAAWAPNAPLPGELAQAWTRSHGNKTAVLALAYAREQVRFSLQEIVETLPSAKRDRVVAVPETLAWIMLAACEALAHEAPSAVPDRVRAILDLSGYAASIG